MTTPASSQTDVLIIGAGPVGLTLAAELARHGVTGVRLVERRAGVAAHSNALVVNVRTREVLDAMGAHGPFAERGFPVAVASLHAFGRPVADLRLDGVDSPHPTPLILPQHETERILQAHLESLGGRVEHNVEAVSLAPDADGVTVTLRHLLDGPEETVRVRWLVGCEGSRSLTRQTLDIAFEGERYAGDAFNLGWKLAAIVRGQAPETLLDTFDAERHATAAQLVAGTDRAHHAAIHPGPVAAFALRHLAPALAPLDAVQRHVRTLMSEFNVAYPDSPLTERHGSHHGDPKAGHRAPDAPVSLGGSRAPGSLFDDVFRGTHWTLLLFTGSGERPDADACRRLSAAGHDAATGSGVNVHPHLVFGAPVPDFETPDDALLDFGGTLHARYGVGKSPALCLVRPDGYVGFRGGLGDAKGLDTYLRRVSTAAAAAPANLSRP